MLSSRGQDHPRQDEVGGESGREAEVAGQLLAYTGGRHRDYSEEPFMKDPEGNSAYDHYGNSYVANCFWVGVGGSGGNPLTSNSPYLQPLSRIPSPGNTVVYLEVPARCVWLWGEWTGSRCEFADRPGKCTGNFKTVPGWHRRPFNFVTAFCDGHAAMVEMKGCQRPSPNLGLQNYPYMGPTCVDREYDCAICIVVRGPGWQLDTLPAPGVLTTWRN